MIKSGVFLAFVTLALATNAGAFVPNTSLSNSVTALSMSSSSEQDPGPGRRKFFQQVASAAFAATGFSPVAQAGLLDDFGGDPGKIVQKEPEAPKPIVGAKKGDKAIDPSLRASYYYPTAKKRYLPRIQKVSNTINAVPTMIYTGDWEQVQEFYKTADNAVLPMKLYVSSLDGQGLGMTNSYARTMKADSDVFEKECGQFLKAIQKENKDLAVQCVSEMGQAVTDYRQTGRLTDDDGNIPSVDDLRRMAMRKPTGNY